MTDAPFIHAAEASTGVSLAPRGDALPVAAADTSPKASRDVCPWCRGPMPDDPRARWCSKRCRQAGHRARRLAAAVEATDRPLRIAYADPPYPGLSRRYYGREATYAGEVDHVALVARLVAEFPDGWALSTSAAALRTVLPLCPPEARVCAWVKPHGVPEATRGPHNTWEPLIIMGGRQLPPGVPDALRALPARLGGSSLMGRKPIAFCVWLFSLLGMRPSDELTDLFPGSGIVSAAWRAVSSKASGDVSLLAAADASERAPGDVSFSSEGDASFGADDDAGEVTP